MQARWLHEHGLISCYGDMLALPLPVLEDALIVMEADMLHQKAAKAKADRGVRR